ncbi:MAG: nucleotide sugar dehydrogenase [Patescibacteria group bacterium]
MKPPVYESCIIGGAGHVGLPLGVVLALKGVKTVLFDINRESLKKIESGAFPFKEKDGAKNLKQALNKKMLFVSPTPKVITQSRFIFLVVGTPIDEYLNPHINGIFKVLDDYFDYFRDGQVVILRSTVYPNTSERIQRYFEERKKKIRVAFCPERIVEGNALHELQNLPQIVSAFDSETLDAVKNLFEKITKRKIIPVKPIEAELAKLFCNAWRYIHFSIANQFFMMASDHGLDYSRIHNAMVEDYERNKDMPRPGFAAGPCLLKDTMQLAAFSNNNFFLGHTAMLVNEGLPNHIMHKLSQEFPDIKTKTIGILGMAFKADSDDHRDSLSFKLKKIAETKCKRVLCHDFHIKNPSFHSLPKLLKQSDIIVLAAPHKQYKNINVNKYKDKKIVDIWNFWKLQ